MFIMYLVCRLLSSVTAKVAHLVSEAVTSTTGKLIDADELYEVERQTFGMALLSFPQAWAVHPVQPESGP
jgi:hypothetical protein